MSDTFNHEADAWDSLLFNDDDDGMPVYQRQILRCKHCGKSQLNWVKTHTGKWWMWDRKERKWHDCKKD